MVDAARSAQMAKVRGKDTKPEIRVRRALHAAGLRFRLHAKELPGKPDIVFRSRRIAIFVHGCFWHRHDDPECKLARLPKTRLDFWLPKLDANRQRDERTLDTISSLGWEPIVIWECQTKDKSTLDALINWISGRSRLRDVAPSAKLLERGRDGEESETGT
jgi:DNA mismatch endonuclease (patch repair protein)